MRAARSLKTQLRHKTTTATTHCSCEHNKENSREKPCRTKQHSESDREECCEESSNVPSLGFGGARGVCVCLGQVALGTKRQCVRRAQTLPGVTTPPLSSTKHSLGKPDPKANKSRKKEGKNNNKKTGSLQKYWGVGGSYGDDSTAFSPRRWWPSV